MTTNPNNNNTSKGTHDRWLSFTQFSTKKQFLLIASVMLIHFLGNSDLFMAGQFVSEDSFYFYATAYNQDWLTSITTPYAGYLHILPMLLAELLWNVPFEILPWVNHAVALFICAFSISWLYAPSCRSLIPQDGLRLVGVLLLALIPFQPNLGMLLGLHWYLPLTLGLMLLGNLPQKPKSISMWSVFAVLAAWSSPAMAVLIPIAFIRWWQHRKNPSRYFPLVVLTASFAYAATVTLVYKPASSMSGFSELCTAFLASFKMLQEGLLYQCLLGPWLGNQLPIIFSIIIPITALATGTLLLWQQRKQESAFNAIALLYASVAIIFLTMMRGHQSSRLLEIEGLSYERYLTTPTLFFLVALLILLSKQIQTSLNKQTWIRYSIVLIFISWMSLLFFTAPPLEGDLPLDRAFPHADKARVLRSYELKYAQNGQAETLALPGWSPIECMRLEIGGGRHCEDPNDLLCIFGNEIIKTGENEYRVNWLGNFTVINKDLLQHETFGRIHLLGYSGGFYWLQDPNGQQFLTGPAIYPKKLKWPPDDLVWVKAK